MQKGLDLQQPMFGIFVGSKIKSSDVNFFHMSKFFPAWPLGDLVVS